MSLTQAKPLRNGQPPLLLSISFASPSVQVEIPKEPGFLCHRYLQPAFGAPLECLKTTNFEVKNQGVIFRLILMDTPSNPCNPINAENEGTEVVPRSSAGTHRRRWSRCRPGMDVSGCPRMSRNEGKSNV